eukprot:Opistho-1_new@104903
MVRDPTFMTRGVRKRRGPYSSEAAGARHRNEPTTKRAASSDALREGVSSPITSMTAKRDSATQLTHRNTAVCRTPRAATSCSNASSSTGTLKRSVNRPIRAVSSPSIAPTGCLYSELDIVSLSMLRDRFAFFTASAVPLLAVEYVAEDAGADAAYWRAHALPSAVSVSPPELSVSISTSMSMRERFIASPPNTVADPITDGTILLRRESSRLPGFGTSHACDGDVSESPGASDADTISSACPRCATPSARGPLQPRRGPPARSNRRHSSRSSTWSRFLPSAQPRALRCDAGRCSWPPSCDDAEHLHPPGQPAQQTGVSERRPAVRPRSLRTRHTRWRTGVTGRGALAQSPKEASPACGAAWVGADDGDCAACARGDSETKNVSSDPFPLNDLTPALSMTKCAASGEPRSASRAAAVHWMRSTSPNLHILLAVLTVSP